MRCPGCSQATAEEDANPPLRDFVNALRVWGRGASVRTILYMATVTPTLCRRGKPRKVALVAAMRKLLLILNAVVRDQTPPRAHSWRGLTVNTVAVLTVKLLKVQMATPPVATKVSLGGPLHSGAGAVCA